MVSLRRRRRTKMPFYSRGSSNHTVGTSKIQTSPKESHDSAWLLDPSLQQEPEETMHVSEFLQSYLLRCRFSQRAARRSENGASAQGPPPPPLPMGPPKQPTSVTHSTRTTPATTLAVAPAGTITTGRPPVHRSHQRAQNVVATTNATKIANTCTKQSTPSFPRPSPTTPAHLAHHCIHEQHQLQLQLACAGRSTMSMPVFPTPPPPGHSSYYGGDQDRARLFWLHSSNFYNDIPKNIFIPTVQPQTELQLFGANDNYNDDDHDDMVSEVSVDLDPESTTAPKTTAKVSANKNVHALVDDTWPCQPITASTAATRGSNNQLNDIHNIGNTDHEPHTLEEIDLPPPNDNFSPKRSGGMPCQDARVVASASLDDDTLSVRWPSDEDCTLGEDDVGPAITAKTLGVGAGTTSLSTTTQRLAKSAANFFLSPHFDCGVGYKYCTATNVPTEALASRDDDDTIEVDRDVSFREDDGGAEEVMPAPPQLCGGDDHSSASSGALSIGSSWTSYEALGQPVLYDYHYYRSLRNCHDHPHTIPRVHVADKRQKQDMEPTRQFAAVPGAAVSFT